MHAILARRYGVVSIPCMVLVFPKAAAATTATIGLYQKLQLALQQYQGIGISRFLCVQPLGGSTCCITFATSSNASM
jgi:hypothetical protein